MRSVNRSTATDDSVKQPTIKPVSAEQIRALIKFLPILESINPEDLAWVVKPPAPAKDRLVIGQLEYHPAVHEFMRACYDNGFVQPFDWPAWAKEGGRYINDSELVGTARLNTCIKLITASLRYERFCDGHLGEVIKSGHIAAILRRLKRLADTRPENTENSKAD
jgi:ADP-ribosyl-[dinitrogen reductase] hydrolase